MPAPANDNIANAQQLTSGTSITGDTTEATVESSEGAADLPGTPGPTVWYRWTCPTPAPGPVTFNTIGSSFDTVIGIFRKAVAAGVNIAYGTDAGVYPHGNNAKQFPYMVRYGMTPMQALQSATIQSARLLRREKTLGSIAPGKQADLVALACNPIADIHCTAKPVWVMKDGVTFDGAAK